MEGPPKPSGSLCFVYIQMYSKKMSKVVTVRLGEEQYKRIRAAAQADNRPISNFMETATLRFLEQTGFVDEQEVKEIRVDKQLMRNLKAGSSDIKKGRYKVVRNRRDGHVR